MTADPLRPREPEIEAMARGARRFLWLLRGVLFCAGCYGLGYGLWRSFAHEPAASSKGFLWLATGLLLALRVEWTFGRGRWIALALCAALWWLPLLIADEESYAWIVRMVGTLAAFLSLFVWRTLWSLTKPLGG